MNIALAHGILGFGSRLGIEYFNGVKEHLETGSGAWVLVTEVNPVASVAERARQLREQILHALGDPDATSRLDPHKKVHIIAHSMGGLDSRLILSPRNTQNIADRVASLTTIGTPHNGSPVADLVYSVVDGNDALPFARGIRQRAKDAFEQLIGQPLFDGLRDLTTARAHEFNQAFPDAGHQAVRYFCVAGVGRSQVLGRTCNLLLPTYEYIKWKSDGEDNDGMVPRSSAERSGGEEMTPWAADHFEEVGHNLDRGPAGTPNSFDYLGAYDDIVTRLRAIPD